MSQVAGTLPELIVPYVPLAQKMITVNAHRQECGTASQLVRFSWCGLYTLQYALANKQHHHPHHIQHNHPRTFQLNYKNHLKKTLKFSDTKTLSKRCNQLDLNCPQSPCFFAHVKRPIFTLNASDQLSLPDMEIISQPFELIILRTRTLHLGKNTTPERLTSQKNLVFPGWENSLHITCFRDKFNKFRASGSHLLL